MCLNNPPPARRYKSDIVCIFRVRFFFFLWRVMIQVYNYTTTTRCVCDVIFFLSCSLGV
jgi:hypothetical protein